MHPRSPDLSFQLERNVYCVLGLPIDAMNMDEAVAAVRHAAFQNQRLFLSTPNLNFLIAAQKDPKFRESVIQSDLNLADGMSLVWVAKMLGLPIHERVSGASLFERLVAHEAEPIKVFFFGGAHGVARMAGERVNQINRGVRCVGYEEPGFGSIEEMSDSATLDRINQSGAHFLIVALGAKKGQDWIMRNKDRLHAPVVSHLGAVINFAAHTIKRAPAWVQKLGMEWAWRIKEEPELWRRYWDDGRILFRLLFTQVIHIARFQKEYASTAASAPEAELQVLENDDRIEIVMSGVWRNEDLPAFKSALVSQKDKVKKIFINLDQVVHISPLFLGMMILIHTYFKQHGLTLEFQPIPKKLAQLIRLNGIWF
jgi:N-acetylglucosaminyldiphosphoundecaprenol N-acetyl-beta-D-mannosaminyltransferase